MPQWICALVILFSVFLTNLANAQEGGVPSTWVQRDLRLKKVVTLSLENVSLTEVLEQVSKQSGIRLEVNPKETLSATNMVIFCKEITVVDLLNSLWSVLGYQNGKVQWLMTDNKGVPQYRLVPAYHKRLPEIMKQKGKKYFVKQLETLVRLSQLPPERRSTMDKEYAEAFMSNKHTWTSL